LGANAEWKQNMDKSNKFSHKIDKQPTSGCLPTAAHFF